MKTSEKENLIRDFHNAETLVRHNISKALIKNKDGEGEWYWHVCEPWRSFIDIKLFSSIEMALEYKTIKEVNLDYIAEIIIRNEDLTIGEYKWWKEWVIDYWENVTVDISHRIFWGKGRYLFIRVFLFILITLKNLYFIILLPALRSSTRGTSVGSKARL
jgi:hypothetical protein